MKFEETSVYDTPDQSPGFLLWQVSTTWRGSIEKRLKTIGLTHPQFVILATLGWLTKDGNRVTQAAVGKIAGLDPNTVSQVMRGLEQKNFIHRKKSSDSRAKNPILTSRGSEVLQIALPAVETKDEEFFQHLTQKDREQLMRIFQKMLLIKGG